jgi:uracil-DNA glycosylase
VIVTLNEGGRGLIKLIETLEELYEKIVRCRKCEISKSRTNVVPGEGPADAYLMIVGEAPGKEEDLEGRPFVGRAGKLLNEMLAAIGIKREEVYVTNILKCRPISYPVFKYDVCVFCRKCEECFPSAFKRLRSKAVAVKGLCKGYAPSGRDSVLKLIMKLSEKGFSAKDRKPNDKEIAACHPFLMRQITLIKPKIICPMGATAVKTLINKRASVTQVHGVPHERGGITFFPMYHPAAALYAYKLKKTMTLDFNRLKDLLASL